MRQLFEDLLATIFFLVVYVVSGDIFVATGIAIAAGLVQIGYLKAKRRAIDTMQWGSLALVIVLGGATIATRDGRFIMIKPSIVHFAIAAIMLRRGWMGRYLPRIATDNLPESVIVGAGYAWAALMVVLGLTNLVIAWAFDEHVWIWFISVGAVGAKVVFALGQLLLFRYLVRRRLRLRAA
ncbi:MAG TPA: septation protein IspZ [Stellaceae bacterium]